MSPSSKATVTLVEPVSMVPVMVRMPAVSKLDGSMTFEAISSMVGVWAMVSTMMSAA